MNKTDKTDAALEMFSSVESIREVGIKAPELAAIRDRIEIVLCELEKAAAPMGLFEVSCHQFREPIAGPASAELQAEIDIHNDHTGDNKHKSDYLVSVLEE
jgi:hypothetical protein